MIRSLPKLRSVRTRNPMYVGGLLIVLGHVVWTGAATVMLYGALLFVAYHLFVLPYEEPRLRERLRPFEIADAAHGVIVKRADEVSALLTEHLMASETERAAVV